MRNGGVSCAAGNIDKHVHGWTGKARRTGSVRDDDKRFDALLRLKQGASKASQPGAAAAADGLPAADGGGGTDAAGSPAADGGGGTGAAGSPAADGVGGTASAGGVTDADIEFTRKISALEAQIEQLEERNANLEESLQSLDSKFSSILTSFKQFASSLPSF